MTKEKIMCLRAGMLGALVALLVLGVGGEVSAQPKAAPPPFKIAIVTSITGPGYAYAGRGIIGARYRIEEEINKSGGINGYPVNVTFHDTATKADQAAMLVERAVSVDKVFAILGPNTSSDVAAAFPTAKRLAIPCITFAGIFRGLCEQNAPWCFSVMVSNDFGAEVLALLAERYKAKNIVFVADAKYNAGVAQTEWGYKIAEREGLKVLHAKGSLDVETGWPDFTPQITRIKSLRPDLLSVLLMTPDFAHFLIALKRGGFDVKTVPVFGYQTTAVDVIAAAGEAAEGAYGCGDFDMQSADPVQQAWMKKLTDYGKTITSDPGIYTVEYNTATGYDAATFLCEAIKRANITPNTLPEEARLKIRDELGKIKMKTYSSVEFRFSEGGKYEKNRLAKPVYLYQVKGGKLVAVGQVAE